MGAENEPYQSIICLAQAVLTTQLARYAGPGACVIRKLLITTWAAMCCHGVVLASVELQSKRGSVSEFLRGREAGLEHEIPGNSLVIRASACADIHLDDCGSCPVRRRTSGALL